MSRQKSPLPSPKLAYIIKEEKPNNCFLSTANLNGKNFNCILKKLGEGVPAETLFSFDHEHVTKYLDTYKDDNDDTFVVMEPCELFFFEYIEKNKLSPENCLYLTRQVLVALQYAHLKGVYLEGFDLHSLVILGKKDKIMIKFYDFYQEKKDPAYIASEIGTEKKAKPPTLKEILCADKLQQAFENFLKGRFCEENLYFLNDVKELKKDPSKRFHFDDVEIQTMISKYFTGGSRELNVPQSLFESCLALKETPMVMFDELDAFIYHLLEDNSGPFVKSAEYLSYHRSTFPDVYACLEKQDLYSVGVLMYRMASGKPMNQIEDFKSGKEKMGHEILDKIFVSLTNPDNKSRMSLNDCLNLIPQDSKFVVKSRVGCL